MSIHLDFFFFSSRRRHTRLQGDWSSDVCSSDLVQELVIVQWGPLGDSVAVPDLLQGVVMWGSFVYPKYRLFVIGFTAVLAVLLWWLLERSEEHTSELQSPCNLVCRLLLEKKKPVRTETDKATLRLWVALL